MPPPTPPPLTQNPVYTSPTSTYDTFLESLGQDLSNPSYIGLISGVILTPHPQIGLTIHLKCHHTFIPFEKCQDKVYKPQIGLIKGGNFNPTTIDRVNKSISNNIRLIYKCHTLSSSSSLSLSLFLTLSLSVSLSLFLSLSLRERES